MKSAALTTTVAILAAIVVSVDAQAQTGRPSTTETQAADASPHAIAADSSLGSYGRYLMLNGATRDEALAASRNIDHPAVRSRLASGMSTGSEAKGRVRR